MNLQVDFSKTKGRIKPMHAVNNMPTCPGDPYGLYRKFTEASIPYARLHDTGGCYGGARYVDIENIFPDFDPPYRLASWEEGKAILVDA